jgi:hypothetical protein
METLQLPKEERRSVGRPTKKVASVIDRILESLRSGYSVSRAAKKAGVHSKTVQRWLKQDTDFLRKVAEAQSEGLPRAKLVTWINHPFRGKRPPRPKSQRNKPYPTPIFQIPLGWRYHSYRGRPS